MIGRAARALAWGAMLLLALFVVAYAAFVLATGAFPAPLRATLLAERAATAAHIGGGALALALAPLQLLPQLRGRRAAAHRWLGRAAMVGLLVGGLGGLAMSFAAHGGLPARLGFGAMALAWLGTAALGYRAIRAGRAAEHRRWMVRNVALTLAAVTLRLWLPLLLAGARMPFEQAYPLIAWLCWVPNLLAAELILRAGRPALALAAARSART